MWIAGIAIYLRTTRAKDRIGTMGFWPMIVLLTALWLGAIFGPPPPDARAAAWSALSMLLIFAWGYWVDRHRSAA
jgi:hypothetical protein